MIIVVGSIYVKAGSRDTFINRSIESMKTARRIPECFDFSVSPDAVDDNRVNIFEAWVCKAALDNFRGNGPEEDIASLIETAQVRELNVVQPCV